MAENIKAIAGDDDISIMKQLVAKYMKGMKLTNVYDYGNSYLIRIDAIKRKEDDFVMDPYYLVDKKTGKPTGYAPFMHKKEFNAALKRKLM